MYFQICMENCDLQIVIDEKQAIHYLVKYASNPEQISYHMNDIIQSLSQSQTVNDLKAALEE